MVIILITIGLNPFIVMSWFWKQATITFKNDKDNNSLVIGISTVLRLKLQRIRMRATQEVLVLRSHQNSQ